MAWYKWACLAKTLQTDWLLSHLFPVRHDTAVRSIQIEKNREGLEIEIDKYFIAISIRDRLIAQPYGSPL